jgi:hypothetical protein
VVVEPDTHAITVEFAPAAPPAAALLLSSDPATAPLLGRLEHSPGQLVRARFANVPDGEYVLVLYLAH